MTASRPHLHLVVTCTNRKRDPVPSALHLRRVTGVRTATRAKAWTTRLIDSKAPTVPAGQLYAGEHWEIAQRLPELASGFGRVTLWIASAGWGLIPATAAIRPYSATFSAGHPDSVPDGSAGAEEWWDALSEWDSPVLSGPRSLKELAADHPRSRLMVILSRPYFTACRADLTEARDELHRPNRLSVVATGVTDNEDASKTRLPGDARLQHRFGGTRGSLNVRVAAHLLRSGLIDHHAMARNLTRILAKQPTIPVYDRTRLSDDSIRRFIRTQRRRNPTVYRSTLLRELREANMACEQGRFADLFRLETGQQ